jgi:histidinol phosphatase-like PHP family hydrolase
VQNLEREILGYAKPDGTLEKIPYVGPRSEVVVREVLQSGGSPTVERAIDASGKRAEIDKRRRLRANFLTRARVLAVLNDDTLNGPSLADYRGDLQMHSNWSDGTQLLSDIVETGTARGYQYCAVTDHSHGLRIARGLSMEDVSRQHREIDRLNRCNRRSFRLIKGVEANIRADGSVDLTPIELAQFELVIAAPHSSLRSEKDQTPRMIAAVETAGVHILGHPRGRMYGSRPGVNADWPRVFAAAAKAGVAIEIDGDPSRQDLDHVLAKRALEEGCLFALDSDAHSTPEFVNAETAVAHARLAGIPVDRVINSWPLHQLLEWLDSGRTRQEM